MTQGSTPVQPGRAWLVGLVLAACLALAACGATEAPRPEFRPAQGTVADTARAMIGQPYCYGGSTPGQGFDCSGLVQWCYAQHGINLPRRTEDLLNVGRRVDKSELVNGDLVFFVTGYKVSTLHVGIYTGHGRFVHSPTTGSQVREESLYERYWVRTYLESRRIYGP